MEKTDTAGDEAKLKVKVYGGMDAEKGGEVPPGVTQLVRVLLKRVAVNPGEGQGTNAIGWWRFLASHHIAERETRIGGGMRAHLFGRDGRT